jgi:hypothetical protein
VAVNRKAWRICDNPKYNDWNDEPEKIVVPYTIINETDKAYLVERNGWHGKKHQHYIPKGQFYFTKEKAEAELRGGA